MLWVKNCSSDRIQRVGMNEWFLEQREVKWEGLQGMALRGVLLKIFINGLEKWEMEQEVKSVQVASDYLGFCLLMEEWRNPMKGKKKFEELCETLERFSQTERWNSWRILSEINAKLSSHGNLSVLHREELELAESSKEKTSILPQHPAEQIASRAR